MGNNMGAMFRQPPPPGAVRLEARLAAPPTADAAALARRFGADVGRVLGVVPREELTGSAELGHDLLEIELGGEEDEEADEEDEGVDLDTVLVPYVPQIVRAVLPERRLVLVDPPEGLLDLVQPKRRARVVIRGLLKAEGAT